jgi:hypothetical protein
MHQKKIWPVNAITYFMFSWVRGGPEVLKYHGDVAELEA